MCCFDISKAFDKVNHDCLFFKLIERSTPLCFVNILKNWYGKLFSRVRWSNILSSEFLVNSGIRQGGILSPLLFSVYINSLLIKLDKYGCFINGICYGSIMYADDLVLLSNSLREMQIMLDICCSELDKMGLFLNEGKSYLMRFGKGWDNRHVDLLTSKGIIPKVDTGTYLGVVFVAGSKGRIDVHKNKNKFYASFNSLYSTLGKTNTPFVSLHLTHSIALPCLLYGMEAVVLNKTTMRELELPWSRAFMKVFNTFDLTVVQDCQQFCGYSTVQEMINNRRQAFINSIIKSKFPFLCNIVNSC